ncbi:DEAD/DEAH box helicase [Iamia sp. SCSIO 61187]|uniref:DEAD/DEAH box helicase n=1 Tax=Iamia sp. SCSIO 61187 TaxID=2722752 RepID=UPI001C624D33|nr:DEAD/DEAH box helicase [Iamia sp. SCSIO 61187]QYG92723.1 DEAD/DEAH box helicase [Iamia sp. SCSIO 61187]
MTRAFEAAVWAAVEGRASDEQRALLEADPAEHLRVVERLIDDTDDRLDAARQLRGSERALVVADFESDLALLESTHDLMTRAAVSAAAGLVADPAGEVRLQASWSAGDIVLWAGGPGVAPADNDDLADRIEATGAPAMGWSVHPGVRLPGGVHAEALSIPVHESLGWLVAVGGGQGGDGLGASVTWLGRVAIEAVRLVAQGRIVPSLRSEGRSDSDALELNVRWVPAVVDEGELARLADAMPGPVIALGNAEPRTLTRNVLAAVVDAVASDAAGRLDLPAPPPVVRNALSVAEAVITRLDGSTFTAPVAAGAEVSKRLQRWTKAVVNPNRPTLVVELAPPDKGDAWFLRVLGTGAEGTLLDIEVALVDGKDTKALGDELARLERLYDVLLRPGGRRRGQVYLSQDEAWELMTITGSTLEAAGFEVRVPPLSRRKPSAGLRMFTEPTGDTVVGAHQLSNVRWTALFDDVELTAAEVARLAAEARPLVRSRGRWVELDRADLKEAAAALAERADLTQMTGAEILRHSVGLEGTPLAGGLTVEGSSWASDLLAKASGAVIDPVTRPPGFEGELRSYQAEALGWLGFLDATELGGCLALDMGLGKTPTVLAHLGRSRGDGKALVIAPPAVVGNWAAEAARFSPELNVVVHHGAGRAAADELDDAFGPADVVITTYGTAVRDIEALAAREWRRVVLDEAQAIKNHTNETAQQLRRLPARTRIALTGTPIENGLGDLWAILDFTNPGLVGGRAAFIAQLSGEGEAALRALNGILVFRRTKSEPEVAAELPDRIDELDHCAMTPEQIGLYQAVLDGLVADTADPPPGEEPKQGAILAAITALKQICNHPVNYQDDGGPLAGRSGKLARLEEIVDAVFAAGEKLLIFTHFASWGVRLAEHLTSVTGQPVDCYHGGLARGARDRMIADFQTREGPGALVLSLKAGGTGLNLTAASHVVLYDRWWNPAVEDQARDRAWRIGQTRTVISHRLVCPGTVDERVEEVVAGKRHIADLVLPKSSSLADLDADQLRVALGLRPDSLLTEDEAADETGRTVEEVTS